MTEHEEWLEERRKHLGASEAAAVLGLNPHMSPIDVWISKVSPQLAAPRDDTDFLEFGTDLEPAIERRYVRDTGNKVYRPTPAIVVHPKYPELACTPDGLCDSPEPIVIEYKFEKWSDGFGSPGSDEIPEHFLVQGCHQMACCDRNRVDFGVLHGAPPIRVYRARRDFELEKELVERLRQWWSDFVLKQVEPPIDSSPGWSDYLAAKHPWNKGEIVKLTSGPDDCAIVDAVNDLVRVRSVIAEDEKIEEEKKNILRAFIGDRDGLICPDKTKITWRRSKDTVEDVTDWKLVAATIATSCGLPKDQWQETVDSYTQKGVTVRKGSRRFLFTEPK